MKNRRSFVPILAGALMGVGVMAAPAAAQLTGHVKSVEPAANRLVLTETTTGTDYTIAVPAQAMIVTNSGRPLAFTDLRKGDGLSVSQVGGVASRIVAEQARLVGTVKSADPNARRLVIREAVPKGEEKAQKDLTLRVDDQTLITMTDGKAVKLGDLKDGDAVSIAHAGDLAQKIEASPKLDELTGFVKSISADLKSFVVTQTGTNENFTVAVNPETVIETTEGKSLKFKELKEGDGVGISHVSSVAKKIVVAVKPPR